MPERANINMLHAIRQFREYLKLSEVGPISRRYFVMNSFDGAMTMLGVIMGAYVSGVVHEPRIIIGAGLGASFAMGVSGFAGAYMTERAERMGRLRKLRRAMLTDLRRTVHARAMLAASLWAALIDGLSPALGSILPMVPYILAHLRIVEANSAFIASMATIMTMLFGLGIFLGKVSEENVLVSGLKMAIVGAVTAGVIILVGAI